MSTRLYVGNLPEGTTEDALAARFAPFLGSVRVDFPADGPLGFRGFAFVSGSPNDDSAVSKCVKLLNRSRWKGNPLRVAEAQPDYRARLEEERAHTPEQTPAEPVPTTEHSAATAEVDVDEPIVLRIKRRRGVPRLRVNLDEVRSKCRVDLSQGPSREDRRQAAEERRRLALEERAKALESPKGLAGKTLGASPSHTKFDTSNPAEDGSASEHSDADRAVLPLFSDDDDSDGEPGNQKTVEYPDHAAEGSDTFAPRKGFDAPDAQRLLQMEQRWRADERFRLTSSFLDQGMQRRPPSSPSSSSSSANSASDDDGGDGRAGSDEEDAIGNIEQERAAALGVLGDILGDSAMAAEGTRAHLGPGDHAVTPRAVQAPAKQFGGVRFDPSSSNATELELRKAAPGPGADGVTGTVPFVQPPVPSSHTLDASAQEPGKSASMEEEADEASSDDDSQRKGTRAAQAVTISSSWGDLSGATGSFSLAAAAPGTNLPGRAAPEAEGESTRLPSAAMPSENAATASPSEDDASSSASASSSESDGRPRAPSLAHMPRFGGDFGAQSHSEDESEQEDAPEADGEARDGSALPAAFEDETDVEPFWRTVEDDEVLDSEWHRMRRTVLDECRKRRREALRARRSRFVAAFA